MLKLYKIILNYFFVKKCFIALTLNDVLMKHYFIKDKDEVKPNLGVSKYNTLYLYVFTPEKLTIEHHEEFIKKQLDLLNKAMLEMGLIGSVTTSITGFVLDSTKHVYLIKYTPYFSWKTFFSAMFQLVLLISAILIYIFKIHNLIF